MVFTCEFAVGETLPGNLRHGERKAISIGFVLSVIETKNLLVNVAVKMKRFHSNVGSAQSSLKQAPEVFHSVRVNATVDVPFRVIHNIMHKAIMQLTCPPFLVQG